MTELKQGWDACWDYLLEQECGTGRAWPTERLAREEERRDRAFEEWRAENVAAALEAERRA